MVSVKEIYSQIVLIGAGGTGSNLLSPLCRLLNNLQDINLIIVDGDFYEEKNQKNQNVQEFQLGKSKSETMCKMIQKTYNNLNVSYINEYLDESNINNLKNIISKKNTILIGAVDNNLARKLLDNIFYDTNIKNIVYIDSGNGTIERTGQIIIGYKKDNSIILNPVSMYFPRILEEEKKNEEERSCSVIQNEQPQNIATNVVASTLIFNIINNILSFKYISHNKCFFNCETNVIESF